MIKDEHEQPDEEAHRTKAGRGGVGMQSGAFFSLIFLVLRPGMWDLCARTRD